MDKKTIIGLVLIFAVMTAWMYMIQPSEEEKAEIKRKQDSVLAVQKRASEKAEKATPNTLTKQEELRQTIAVAKTEDSTAVEAQKALEDYFGAFSQAALNPQRHLFVENDLLRIDFNTLGGKIDQVYLAEYKTYYQDSVRFFTKDGNDYGLNLSLGSKLLQTKDLNFEIFVNNKTYKENTPIKVSGEDSVVISMRIYANQLDSLAKDVAYLEYRYTLKGNDYRVGFDIISHNLNNVISDRNTLEFVWESKLRMKEKDGSVENKSTSVYYLLKDEVEYLKENGVDDKKEENGVPIKWISYKQQFFSTALISNTGEGFISSTMQSQTEKGQKDNYLRTMSSNISIPFDEEKNHFEYDMEFFFGPNKYAVISDYDLQMEEIIPLGWGFFLLQWINRFVIIPVFDFLQSFGWSMGLIILILTILVKLVLFPLAYKQFASSAKMKVIAPEVQKINEKYPKQEQAMQKQQAVMNLYKRAGIKPMAGCLPMLIQFPILVAMFRFFPASIELRQQSFLWADDLSTYDSILNLPFNIPFYGNHISLFCLLMTAAQLIYTHISMKQQAQTQTMPGMKFMMYFMPIMMLFIFNSFSAALNYYYFISLCFTFLQMFIIRKTIDEKKVLQRLEANAKKPLKKSKWQQRIEALEKQNQAILEERKKQQQRRK
ncbi:MAG: membrane protein insertase YidC [Bacteroidales bacterium]|nr:membrane protein insertase YidC [Bacteroidales bacterium]MEE1113183.1 membrane protein insertase YidC [Bacteroidales bacterium]MEE1143190.1 membrane protein insertase YidC [Bacteroidales bacterium]